jgi:hypothetical protein
VCLWGRGEPHNHQHTPQFLGTYVQSRGCAWGRGLHTRTNSEISVATQLVTSFPWGLSTNVMFSFALFPTLYMTNQSLASWCNHLIVRYVNWSQVWSLSIQYSLHTSFIKGTMYMKMASSGKVHWSFRGARCLHHESDNPENSHLHTRRRENLKSARYVFISLSVTNLVKKLNSSV